ncbi:MAG: uroporphyrinogen-III synthase [Micrococcales bacterium]|nr:uroporphyrinogen-III synthase [Micrococcales bacterium]
MTTTLTGRTVLVPDSASVTGGALAALVEAGARPLVVPLIEARPVPDRSRLDAALRAIRDGQYGWLAVTSAASVRMLSARAPIVFADEPDLVGLRGPIRASRTRVAAVGDATGRVLAALGIRCVLPERGSGPVALIGPMLCSADGSAVLVARGNLVGPSLPDALRGNGVTVDEVVTHITVRGEDPPARARASWVAGLVDAVLLTSPRAVRGMVDRLGPPLDGMVVGCIDQATADVATASGVHVDTISTEPTAPGLVEALRVTFEELG